MENAKLLIGGELVDGQEEMQVINPATRSTFGRADAASPAQLEAAILAAKSAFPTWSALPYDRRAAVLVQIADRIDAAADDLARLLTLEQGKPLAEAAGEVWAAAAFFRHYGAQSLKDREVDAGPDRRVTVRRRPLGVVGAIVPWNYPIALMAFKLPPALLAGNTIVLKPAPTTPLTTLRFGEIISDVVPPGVVNVVSDHGHLGQLLTQHPDVRKISFTGSTETGMRVMEGAANSLKRITLELGGNDAAIVLEDCDPKEVAEKIFPLAFTNAGQICIAVKRLFVHASIYDGVWDELTALANKAIVGDGMLPGSVIGPVQNLRQHDRVRALIADAERRGAVVSGGSDVPDSGFFIRPTIVRDIFEGTRLVDEEQFGPALPMLKFDSPEEAVERANRNPMGLGGSIWSRDIDRAVDLAGRLDVGTAWINKHADLLPAVPFGGAKHSGIGVELGMEGVSEFTQMQVINQSIAPTP